VAFNQSNGIVVQSGRFEYSAAYLNVFKERELPKDNNVHFLHVYGVKKPCFEVYQKEQLKPMKQEVTPASSVSELP